MLVELLQYNWPRLLWRFICRVKAHPLAFTRPININHLIVTQPLVNPPFMHLERRRYQLVTQLVYLSFNWQHHSQQKKINTHLHVQRLFSPPLVIKCRRIIIKRHPQGIQLITQCIHSQWRNQLMRSHWVNVMSIEGGWLWWANELNALLLLPTRHLHNWLTY